MRVSKILHLTAHPYDLALEYRDGREVLTPNSRAARALDVAPRSLEDMARAILTLAELATAPVLTARRLLSIAVSEFLPDADRLTAHAMAPTLRAIFRSGADLDQLEAAGSTRVRQVAALARAYQHVLRRHGYVDSAEALWVAGRFGPNPCRILLYGYARLGADERAFIDILAGDGSVVLLPYADDPAFAENMEASDELRRCGWPVMRVDTAETLGETILGCQENKAKALGLPMPAQVAGYSYPHLDAEVRGTLGQVQALLRHGVAPDDIAVVTRDEDLYGRSVLDVAWEYGVPIRALYRVPLIKTRLGAWVGLMLEVLAAGFPYERTVELLTHPLGPGISAHRLRDASRLMPSGPAGWGRVGIDLPAGTWPVEDTRTGWCLRLDQVLTNLGATGRVEQGTRDHSALSRLRASLPEMDQPAAEKLHRSAFLIEIREALFELTVPMQDAPYGVELHTPLALYGARYRHVFILGAAEGVLPAPVRDDPVLGFSERHHLAAQGIPVETAAKASRRERLSFYMLPATAGESLTISYPALLRKEEALPSPYFATLDIIPLAAPSMPPNSPEETRRGLLRQTVVPLAAEVDPVLGRARHALAVERHREGPDPADGYDGMVGMPLDPAARTFSATQLTNLGQCSFKWFAGTVLRLDEPDPIEMDLTARQRGNLCHAALSLASELARGASDQRREILNGLAEALDQAAEQLGVIRLSAWRARRVEELATLRRAVEAPDFLRDGAEILTTETSFTGEWHGLRVNGRVDRVDRMPGGIVFVDYKTGTSRPAGAKGSDGKATLDVQLPLYVQAAAPALYPGESVVGAYYYSLKKAQTLAECPQDTTALAPLVEHLRRTLEYGEYPVRPDVDGKACDYCAFDAVCRRGPRLARKEAHHAAHP